MNGGRPGFDDLRLASKSRLDGSGEPSYDRLVRERFAQAIPLGLLPPDQLFAENGDLRRRSDAKPYPAALNSNDGYRHRATRDDDPFAALSTQNEHVNPSL